MAAIIENVTDFLLDGTVAAGILGAIFFLFRNAIETWITSKIELRLQTH